MTNDTDNYLNNATNISPRQLFLQEVTSHWMFKAGSTIDQWWFLILVPIGLIGNSLSMVVMAMKHNRHLSTCTYMMAISINDNVLMILFLYQWLLKNTDIQTLTNTICKILGPFILIFVYNGSYQVVLMTFDKCFAIMAPHRALSFCTPKRAKILLVIIFTLMFLFNSPNFYLHRLVVADCAGNTIQTPLVQAYVYISFVVTGLVPFFSLVIMNGIIIKAVRMSRKMRAEPGNQSDWSIDKMKQVENQLTMMSVIIAVAYIILFLPSHIRFIVYQFVVPDSTPTTYAGFYFFIHLSFRLYATYYGIHFFLYFLSGSKFRNDLRKLFKIKTKESKKNIDESNTSSVSTLSAL